MFYMSLYFHTFHFLIFYFSLSLWLIPIFFFSHNYILIGSSVTQLKEVSQWHKPCLRLVFFFDATVSVAMSLQQAIKVLPFKLQLFYLMRIKCFLVPFMLHITRNRKSIMQQHQYKDRCKDLLGQGGLLLMTTLLGFFSFCKIFQSVLATITSNSRHPAWNKPKSMFFWNWTKTGSGKDLKKLQCS